MTNPKQPRIVIHVGSRKTATTYIQRALGESERALAKAGVYLPKSGRFDLNPTNIAHHNLAFAINGDPRFRPELGDWGDLRSEIERKRTETVLISCEVFEGSIVQEQRGAAVLEAFKTLGSKVTVVLVVREWTAFINSMYNQAVKMFAVDYPFERYVKMSIDEGASNLLERFEPFLRDDSIEFVAIPYSALRNPDPLSAMLQAVDIDVDPRALSVPDRLVNTSLGAIGMEVTTILSKYLNATYDDWAWSSRPAQRLHIENLVALDRKGWNDEKYWGWSPELLNDLLPQIRHDMDSFAGELWGQPWPEQVDPSRPRAVSNFEHYPPNLLQAALNHLEAMERRYEKLRAE